jgi:hypothetical protein
MRLSLDEAVETLCPVMQKSRLVIFAGAGVSNDPPSNLPLWPGLIDRFIEFCETIYAFVVEGEEKRRFRQVLDDAKNHEDQIRVASALKNMLMSPNLQSDHLLPINLPSTFKDWMLREFSGREPNLNHQLIVTANYPFIVTTNYDDLLERSAGENGLQRLQFSSYAPKDVNQIAQAVYQKTPSIIHLHGKTSATDLADIVLTSEDYARIKRRRPGLRLAVQSLFLHYSVLMVGYGGKDPHLEDLLEEIAEFFEWPDSTPTARIFLVAKADEVDSILERHREQRNTDLIALDDYRQTAQLLKRLQDCAPRSSH